MARDFPGEEILEREEPASEAFAQRQSAIARLRPKPESPFALSSRNRSQLKEERLESRSMYKSMQVESALKINKLKTKTSRNILYEPKKRLETSKPRRKSRKFVIEHSSARKKFESKNEKGPALKTSMVEAGLGAPGKRSRVKIQNRPKRVKMENRDERRPKTKTSGERESEWGIYSKQIEKKKTLKYNFEQPSSNRPEKVSNKFVRYKRSAVKGRSKLKSRSSVLRFEDFTFKTLECANVKPLTSLSRIDSPHKKTEKLLYSTMNSFRRRPVSRWTPLRSRANVRSRKVGTSTTLRRFQNAPQTCSSKNIDLYSSKYRRKGPGRSRERGPSSSVQSKKKVFLAGNRGSSDLEEIKIETLDRLESVFESEPRPRKVQRISLFDRNETKKINISRVLDSKPTTKTLRKVNMPRVLPERVEEIDGRERAKKSQTRQRRGDRERELRRMRSPKKKSLLEEYREKIKEDGKSISLKTYYKFPQDLRDLKRRPKKTRI